MGVVEKSVGRLRRALAGAAEYRRVLWAAMRSRNSFGALRSVRGSREGIVVLNWSV
jgi:hypothetical protein